jgi:hydrogenase large subunit
MSRKTIFPVTRVHEPLRIDVEVTGGRVTDAWVGGHLFRGWEPMLTGRDPRDAALFSQRICGICSSAHAVAASLAQQQAFSVEPTPNGQHLTNLIFAADIIQNHLRHFYGLVLYDYVRGPATQPYLPHPAVDYRLTPKINDEIVGHAKTGAEMAARAHEMMAIFGAKAPHQQTIMPTGVTEKTDSERIMAYGAILREIRNFVETVLLADVLAIAEHYKDYYVIGGGYGNFMSFGLFPAPVTGKRAFSAGVAVGAGTSQALDTAQITEDIRYSWYTDENQPSRPETGVTVPARDKADAYSWVKAPRYGGAPVESGPMARAWLSGEWRRGVSVMDRLIARARETLKICRLAEGWLGLLVPGAPSLRPFTPPPQGTGAGLTDAMRGSLGHWFSYQNGKVIHYQIITPTTWNFSPRDAAGKRGPVEEALIGTPVAAADSLVEVGRVVRSFDPCFTCAVHAVDHPRAAPFII